MQKHKTKILSELLREIESDIGTRDMAFLVFESLTSSIKGFKSKNSKDFCEQFSHLVDVVSTTEPKFGILNYNFTKLMIAFNQIIANKQYSEKKWKKLAINEIKRILAKNKKMKKDLLVNSEKFNIEGKTILIHDHSHTVQDVLVHYKKMGRKFRVIIAEQDFEKTHSNIEKLHYYGIDFQVVPSYMLSHIHDQVDMAFFGALTLKDTMDFVMDPGTYGTISELKVDNVPIYIFIETNKFSFWKSAKRSEIFIHKHKRKHHSKPIEYDRIKYSHDRVPSKMFDKIITNKGVFTQDKLKKYFIEKMLDLKIPPRN